jgi:hypothetical protein
LGGKRTTWQENAPRGRKTHHVAASHLIPKYTGLRLDLDRHLHHNETDQALTGRWTKGRTPLQVLGKMKMWSR